MTVNSCYLLFSHYKNQQNLNTFKFNPRNKTDQEDSEEDEEDSIKFDFMKNSYDYLLENSMKINNKQEHFFDEQVNNMITERTYLNKINDFKFSDKLMIMDFLSDFRIDFSENFRKSYRRKSKLISSELIK